jgi:hypothetical protein
MFVNAPLPRLDHLLPASQASSTVATDMACDSTTIMVVSVATEKQES